jgi:hypothetical protein
MRRKVLAAFGLALLGVVVFDAFVIFMLSRVPGPLQGLVGITFGLWLVLMLRNLLAAVTRPADDHRKDRRSL